LILGANGSGKSSLIDALSLLNRFAVQGQHTFDLRLLDQKTRGLGEDKQTFDLQATLESGSCVYRVVFEPYGEAPRVAAETVHFDARPIFEFTQGEVQLYNDSFEPTLKYQIDWFEI
jgi:hypothetical protein